LDIGAIVRREGEWRLVRPLAALPLPRVLARRVEHLSDDARALALAVGILGGETSGDEAAAVAEMPVTVAGTTLRALVRAGLLEERFDAEGRAAYAMHDRFRDVVLESVPAESKIRAHRAAARLLRSRAQGDYRALLDAADHFARAGDTGQAARVAADASRAAERAGRPDRAVVALAAEMRWRRERGEVPLSLWLRRFDLCLLAGQRQAADDAIRALGSLLDRASPAERVAIALRKARLALERGEPAAAREEAEPQVDLAREIGDPTLLSELYWVLARTDEVYGRLSRALEGFHTAADYAEQAGRPDLEARAWLGASLSAVFLGDAARACAFAERALAAARLAADPVATAESLRCLGNAARESGDIQRALKVYRRAVRAARDGGNPESEAKALNNLGTVCQWAGHIREAVAALERSLELKERMGLTASAMTTHNNLGGLFMALGRFDDARRHLQSVTESMGTKEPMVLALAHSNSADLAVVLSELDTAIELYRAAHRMNLERSNAMADSHALSGLVRALIMRDGPGDLDEARAHMDALRALHEKGELVESRSRYHTAFAALFDRTERDDAALAAARRALDIEQERRIRFSDPFGTVLEAQWQEAISLSRLGRASAATRAAARARADLLKTAKHVGDERDVRVFLEANPLHRAILAQRMDCARGWTWVPGR
jgi:tetratricopeptide (TPR) repeat protein